MAKQVINNSETGLVVRTKMNENFTEVYEDVESIEKSMNSNTFGIFKTITKPVGFTWNAPITLYRDKNDDSKISTDFDITDYEYVGSGVTYYVDISRGSDGNNGTEINLAYKTIKKALEQVDVDIIYVSQGYYELANGFNSVTLTRSVSIKALPEHDVKISTATNQSWSLTAAQTYTYETTLTDAYRVFDASEIDNTYNCYMPYVLKSSIATVEATAGTFWIDGTTVYIHTFDERTPDSNIKVYKDTNNLRAEGDITIYLENINFEGGSNSAGVVSVVNTSSNDTSKFYVNNCTAKYGARSGFETGGTEYTYLYKAKGIYNLGDAITYSALNSVIPKSIEVECEGHWSKDLTGAGFSNNGSTAHGGTTVIRVNGEYSNCQGPIVADVQKSIVWCIGCKAFGSLRYSSTAAASFLMSDSSDYVTAWLDSCIGFGNTTGLYVNHVDTTVYTFNCDFTQNINDTYNVIGATITPYIG